MTKQQAINALSKYTQTGVGLSVNFMIMMMSRVVAMMADQHLAGKEFYDQVRNEDWYKRGKV